MLSFALSQSSTVEIYKQNGLQESCSCFHPLPDALSLQQHRTVRHAEVTRAKESSRSAHSALQHSLYEQLATRPPTSVCLQSFYVHSQSHFCSHLFQIIMQCYHCAYHSCSAPHRDCTMQHAMAIKYSQDLIDLDTKHYSLVKGSYKPMQVLVL